MVAQKLQKFRLSVEKHQFEQEEYLFLLCPGMWNFIWMYVFQAFPFKDNSPPSKIREGFPKEELETGETAFIYWWKFNSFGLN